MGRGVLAELLALLRPTVDSGSEGWCVDLGVWEEAFEFCWFGASASQVRLETSESKKAALSRSMVTESRLPLRRSQKRARGVAELERDHRRVAAVVCARYHCERRRGCSQLSSAR